MLLRLKVFSCHYDLSYESVDITKQIINTNVNNPIYRNIGKQTFDIKTDHKMVRQKLETSSANENESCTENSLDVRDNKIGTKNVANL